MIKTLTDILREELPDLDFDVQTSNDPERGHLSTNAAFFLAKRDHASPMKMAEELRSHLHKHAPSDYFEKIEIVAPGFINVWLTPDAIRSEFKRICKTKVWGKGKKRKETAIVEYSSPNIAKPLHVGHLRSTIIGDAIANIYDFLGYSVVRWNYIGDWGTQFGKTIVAYKKWGDREKIKKSPVEELSRLYVKFHEELKQHPELEDSAREEFKKLENGNKTNLKLWRWFKKESLKELSKIYNRLGVRFSIYIGESFYQDKMEGSVRSLIVDGLTKESEGALIVPLEKYGLSPGLIKKSDGATLYLTRDIANLEFRLDEYKPSKIVYVIANEQALHLSQLFAIADLRGLGEGVELRHVKFGLVLGEEGKKFSTREGGVIELGQVLNEAVKRAEQTIKERKASLTLVEAKRVAQAIGIGAIKYNDLSQNRLSDITFDWEKMLSLEGNSGPYLQYTYARLKNILRKARVVPKLKASALEENRDFAIVMKLAEFPEVLKRASQFYMPHYLANYLYELAKKANSFYQSEPVLSSTPEFRNVRLNLVKETVKILKTGLNLLGIETVEKM
ncbi:MAG: arginine--tRNA ligase [Candidatus Colwellbacteria bacterium]|nr:arginine--tRNA ligase [Candidatus Colwellbacteria bacterium]